MATAVEAAAEAVRDIVVRSKFRRIIFEVPALALANRPGADNDQEDESEDGRNCDDRD